MTKDELVARLRDIEWDDVEVKAAKLLYAGIAENAGYGMNKLASWEALTGTRPTIESDRTIATVSFPLKSAVQSLVSTDTDVPVNVPVIVPVNVGVKLTATQRKTLELIGNNPSITHAELSEILSLTERTVRRATKSLRAAGLLRREGSDKTGVWIVVSEGHI